MLFPNVLLLLLLLLNRVLELFIPKEKLLAFEDTVVLNKLPLLLLLLFPKRLFELEPKVPVF